VDNSVIPVLYINDSQESNEAQAGLQYADFPVQKIRIEESNGGAVPVPQLMTKEGIFKSLDQIRWYARVYGKATQTAVG